MKVAKKVILFLVKVIGGFLGLILTYLLCAYIFSRIPIDGDELGGEDVTIYLLTNGMHTDIVVPARNEYIDWTSELKYSDTQSNDSANHYLAMGWGDKGFYLETPTWADLKASVAFKAATGLSTTAIHATYHNFMQVGDSCKMIKVSALQYRKLIAYIKTSFRLDSKGHFINIKTTAVYGKTDAFYEAHGSYSMFHTCNSWVNKGLRASGLKSCLWTPFDTGLFLLYQ